MNFKNLRLFVDVRYDERGIDPEAIRAAIADQLNRNPGDGKHADIVAIRIGMHDTVFPDDESGLKVDVACRDARGVFVDGGVMSPTQAATLAYVYLAGHGTDPDYEGRDADAGSVVFKPIKPEGKVYPTGD